MTESFDFDSESAPPSGNRIHPVLWILGCLGCGGLGLFVMGIIIAIAFPLLLSSSDKAKESKAIFQLNYMTGAQQRFYQINDKFGDNTEELGVGFLEEDYYHYTIDVLPDQRTVVIFASPKNQGLRSYSSAVFVNEKDTFVTGICESNMPQSSPPQMPKLIGDNLLECPVGSQQVYDK